MSTQGMALKATDWRMELFDTAAISRQESSDSEVLVAFLAKSLSVKLEEIRLKLAANLSMRNVSLILGRSQLLLL